MVRLALWKSTNCFSVLTLRTTGPRLLYEFYYTAGNDSIYYTANRGMRTSAKILLARLVRARKDGISLFRNSSSLFS
jgi:hypothetical protein